MRKIFMGLGLAGAMLLAGGMEGVKVGNSLWSKTESPLPEATGTCLQSPLKFTYKYEEKRVGELIKMGKETYVMVKLPFVEFGSGKKYYIKMPVLADKNGQPLGAWVETQYMSSNAKCFHYRLSGYPSLNNRLYYMINQDLWQGGGGTVMNEVVFVTSILVHKTLLSIRLHLGSYKTVQNAPVNGDFTVNAPWRVLKKKTTYIRDLKKLLNTIKIGEL